MQVNIGEIYEFFKKNQQDSAIRITSVFDSGIKAATIVSGEISAEIFSQKTINNVT